MINIIIVNITTRHFQLVLVQSLSGAPLVSPSDPLGTVTPPQYRTLLVLIWHKRCYSYAHIAHSLLLMCSYGTFVVTHMLIWHIC